MTTSKHSKVHSSHVDASTPEVVAAPSAAAAPSPAPNPAGPVVVKPPPANANIPPVPEGQEPTNGTDYRGLVPKKAELAVLGDAVTELRASPQLFAEIFGKAMPALAFIVQVLDAANQWSLLRNKTDAFDLYSRTQEGLVWVNARALMAKMKPVFEAGAAANSEVATAFPSLGLLLGAAKVIAKRGAATRKGNGKKKANGEAATQGAVGKKRKKAEEVAALKAETAAAAAGEGHAAGAGAGATAAAAVGTPAAAATPAGPVNGATHG